MKVYNVDHINPHIQKDIGLNVSVTGRSNKMAAVLQRIWIKLKGQMETREKPQQNACLAC